MTGLVRLRGIQAPGHTSEMAIVDSLLLRLSGKSPLHEQIYAGLRERILSGVLPADTRLPSSRQLASQLGVARSTVLQALDALAAEGYLVTRAAASTRVAPELPSAPERPPPAQSRRAVQHRLSRAAKAVAGLPQGAVRLGAAPRVFRPGVPALELFPSSLWARLAARQAVRASASLLSGDDAQGNRKLRAAIAAHLSAARGVRCVADQVFITSGTQGAFEETARLVLDPGDSAWVEDPGYPGARAALLLAGARPVPVPVDERGLDVAAGIARAPDARLVTLAPSHQYPLGVTLSLPRRLALLRWAARARAFIIEDDYDSEFRHRGRPLTALQGLDERGCVVYVGTFSKTLFPGLRIGFLVAPDGLVDALRASRSQIPAPASALDQATLAAFIEGGHFATHLRRMRGVYRERGEALVDALRSECKGALDVHPPETGLQLWASCADDVHVRDAAAARGIETGALSSYCLRGPKRSGLVLGFGAVRPEAMRAAAARLAGCLQTPFIK